MLQYPGQWHLTQKLIPTASRACAFLRRESRLFRNFWYHSHTKFVSLTVSTGTVIRYLRFVCTYRYWRVPSSGHRHAPSGSPRSPEAGHSGDDRPPFWVSVGYFGELFILDKYKTRSVRYRSHSRSLGRHLGSRDYSYCITTFSIPLRCPTREVVHKGSRNLEMIDILHSPDFVEGDERSIAKASLDAAEEKLRGLCASHAGTFVSVERRGAALEDSLKQLFQRLTSVQTQVGAAQHWLEQEEDSDKSFASMSEKHRIRRRTLLQHSSLLELLELPSLMDACVKSNLYDEAISITAFANTLERRHTEHNQVVLSVIAQVRSRQGDLRRHLLQCLKNPVTMPECLEVITALRRLNSIDLERLSQPNLERVHSAMEMALQVDFLEARNAWLDQTNAVSYLPGLGNNQSGDGDFHSSEKILDIVERYRTR